MTRVVRNPAFEAEVQAEPEFVAQMGRTTTHVADLADQDAATFENTGYYRRRIRGRSLVDVKAIEAPNSAGGTLPRGTDHVVLDTDPFAHLVEGGSVNNPPYAPLQKGARAAGLRLEDPRK